MYQVLLLCKDNTIITPMAYGYYRSLGKEAAKVYGAGVINRRLDALAVKVMQEDKIDISKYESHIVGDFKHIDFDFVLTFDQESEAESHHLPSKAVKYHYDFNKQLLNMGNTYEKTENLRIVRNWIKKTIKGFIKEHFEPDES